MGFNLTLISIIFVLYFWQLISGYLKYRAYKNRDPEDQRYWSVDEWADYYRKHPDETLY